MKTTAHLFTLMLLAAPLPLCAQELDYNTFINRVMQGNLEYASAQLDRAKSEADLTAARKINDPAITAEYGNNSDWDIAMGQSLSFGLEKSISLGKRAARIGVARSQLEATEAGLQHFSNTLKAEASLAFVDALLARDRALIGRQNAEQMLSLYQSDSLRYATGDISEIDLLQTRLEASLAQQEYSALLTEYKNALIQLDLLMGQKLQTTQGVSGSLGNHQRLYRLEELIGGADSLRKDLAQQRLEAETAEKEVTLVRRERMPDLDLALGASLNSRVNNEEAPAPQFVGYTVGIGIRLPASNLNRGEVLAAQLEAEQAQIQTDIVRRRAQAEIIEAFNSYQTALDRLSQYDSSIMDHARQVLEGKQYAYRRGETSLLDLINAQHTYNEIQQAYSECLAMCMSAWIELERSAGRWDIQF